MSTLVIYYTYSGRTKAIAEELAVTEPADIVEIKEVRRPGKLKAYTAGIVSSIKGSAWPVQPLDADFSKYDKLIMLSPVWAGNPAPAFNAMLKQLPSGKAISIKMVSRSGESDCRDRLEAIIKEAGGELVDFEDIRVSR